MEETKVTMKPNGLEMDINKQEFALALPPGTHSKTSRRNVELFTLDYYAGRSWERYYLGNGLSNVCKIISRT